MLKILEIAQKSLKTFIAKILRKLKVMRIRKKKYSKHIYGNIHTNELENYNMKWYTLVEIKYKLNTAERSVNLRIY